MILVCEASQNNKDWGLKYRRVHQLTTGPGPQGTTIPCPKRPDGHQSRPVDDGVAWVIEDLSHQHLVHVQGSFGHNHDGYWHYKFHNWNTTDRNVSLEGFCRP